MTRAPDALDLFAVASGWWGPDRAWTPGPARVELTALQSAGAATLARMIERHGGALLADATGLGKSHIALDVADRMGRRPFVIAPAHLRPMWTRRAPDAVAIRSHTKLSRAGAGIDVDVVPSDALLIVDEAHRFRTPTTRRYAALARLVLRAPVLLVTATPLVTGPADLHALLGLFVPAMHLPDDEPGLAACLALRAVRRRRGDVQASAAPGGGLLRWRDRIVLPPVRCTVPADVLDATDAAARAAMPLHGEPARLYASLLLTRLASSPEAARQTVARARNYLVRLDEAARAGRQLDRRSFARAFGLDPDVQLAQTVMPFWYPSGAIAERVEPDAFAALARLQQRLTALMSAPDPRADAIRDQLREGRVVVAFTSHVDTATAMHRRLRDHAATVLLTGAGAVLPAGRVPLSVGVDAFRRSAAAGPCVAIVTPVADEGIDLECADVALHLDLPWTPAVVVQREGRLDRPGARGPMHVVVALPDPDLEARLGLVGRVRRRADEAARLALGVSGRIAPSDGPAAVPGPESANPSQASTALTLGPRWSTRAEAEAAARVLDWRGATLLAPRAGPTVVLGWKGTRVVWAARLLDDGWRVDPPDRALVALAGLQAPPTSVDAPPDRARADARLWRAWDVVRAPSPADAATTRHLRAAARQATVCLACGDTADALVIRTQVIPALRAPRTVGSLAVLASAFSPREAARVPPGPPQVAPDGVRSTTWLLASAAVPAIVGVPIRAYSTVAAPDPSPA